MNAQLSILMFLIIVSQVLFWFGIIYTALLFLRYRRIADWFNRKAREEIVDHFHFRSLIPLVLTWVCGGIGMVIGFATSSADELAEGQIGAGMAIGICLAVAYPVGWLVWRLTCASRAKNPSPARWKLLYDVLLLVSLAGGGSIVITVAVAITVLANLTKWGDSWRRRWEDIAGVPVVPETITYYLMGISVGVLAVICDLFKLSENTVGTIVGLYVLGIIGYLVWKLMKTPREGRRAVAWQVGYMVVSSVVIMLLTWWAIFAIIVVGVIWLALSLMGSGISGVSSGRHNYSVRCNHLSHDLLGGSNKCDISGGTCEALSGGRCPYQ